MTWMPLDDGTTIGTEGSESGVIVADYEHDLGARITIERDAGTVPFAITCSIFGWFFHTRFFSTRDEADSERVAMQTVMETILQSIPLTSDPDCDAKCSAVSDAISSFVDTFP